MPAIAQEMLAGFAIDIRKGTGPLVDERGNVVHDAQGVAKTQEIWTLVLAEHDGTRTITCSFTDVVRAELVRKLTGGIVLAAGGVSV